MKRFLSIILALAMTLTLIPAVSANGETETDGITIEYKTAFAKNVTSPALDQYDYIKTGGRLEYFGSTTSNTGVTIGYRNFTAAPTEIVSIGYFNLAKDKEWWAYKIRVPRAGTYKASLDYAERQGSGDALASMYILPKKIAEDIAGVDSALNGNVSAVFEKINFVGTTDAHKLDDSKEFTADEPGEYYMIWRRDGGSGKAMRPARLTLSMGTPNVSTLIYADVSLAKTELDAGVAEETEINLSNVYMSDGNSATDTDIAKITYKSSDENVAVIENGKVKAVGVGTAKIHALDGEYSLGDTEITVVDSRLSGVKVEYSFLKTDYPNLTGPQDFTYSNSSGKICSGVHTSSNGTPRNWSGNYALFNTAKLKQYHTMKIRVPAAGAYKVSLEHFDAVATDMYILPMSTDVQAVIDSETEKPLLLVEAYDDNNTKETKVVKAESLFIADAAGEYLLLFAAGGEFGAFRPAKLTLDGGNSKSPLIFSDISLGETALEVGETTTFTQGKAYLSNGTETDDLEGVTYKSTDEDVATIESGSVKAGVPGTAKIQAVRADGYVLDEEIVAVTRKNASVSFYAESTDNKITAIEITATDIYGNAVSPAKAAELERGATVTVKAPKKNGYTFRGWMRGTADGQVVSVDSTYSFKAMTHTMLTAVYTQDTATTEYYNFNGEFLGTTEPTEAPTLLGYEFLNKWDEKESDGITRYVAKFEKKADTYTINLEDGITESSKDEDKNYYDTEIVLEAQNEVFWLRGSKPVAFGRTYTFNVWDDTNITTAAFGYDSSLPMVYLDSAKGSSRMIEYDKGTYEIVEVGILFGNAEDELTVDSCYEKANSQWKRDHGQFAAKSDYTNARGYLIYEDGGEYKVIYAD